MPFPSHFSSVVFLSLPNLCVQISSMRTSYLQSSVPRHAALITHISVLNKKKFPWHDRGLFSKLTNGGVNLYFYWMTQSQLLISRKALSAGNPDQDQDVRDFDALHASNPVDFTFKLHSWMSGRALGSPLLSSRSLWTPCWIHLLSLLHQQLFISDVLLCERKPVNKLP